MYVCMFVGMSVFCQSVSAYMYMYASIYFMCT